MMTGARGRHAEDTKWLRKFEAQWGRQERLEAQALPRADRQRACTRGTRKAPEEEAVRQGWGRGQVVGGFSFVRRVHLLTAEGPLAFTESFFFDSSFPKATVHHFIT